MDIFFKEKRSGKIMFFFFSSRRRHTRSKRDWSSDVCSSDLPETRHLGDAGNGGELIADVPVLERAELGEIERVTLEGVFEHPADAGRVRSEGRLDTRGEPS